MSAVAGGDELSRAALLGTARQAPKLPVAGKALTELWAAFDEQDREGTVLGAAAVWSLYRRAGALPEKAPPRSDVPVSVATGDAPRLAPRAAAHLARLLDGEHAEAFPEWLVACAAAGKRAPEERLPRLLDLGAEREDLQGAIRGVLGARGTWLARQNEAWNWAAAGGAYLDETRTLDAWQTAPREARLGILGAVRAAAPERALKLLETTWAEDAAEDRVRFLQALLPGLAFRDEPFLELGLDDKRKEVRKAAAGLLLKIPESRLLARALARAQPLLLLKSKLHKKALEVAPPELCDKAMQRDGIEPKPPAGTKLGEKAWLLLQMLAQVPPEHWSATLDLTPQALLKLAVGTDWDVALLHGWQRAAVAFRDAEWLAALIEIKPPATGNPAYDADPHAWTGEIVCALPPGPRDDQVLRAIKEHKGRLADKKGEGPVYLLRDLPRPWSAKLSEAVLAALRREAASEFNWPVAETAKAFGMALPFEALSGALKEWPTDAKEWENWREKLEPFLALIQFRHDMREALNE